MSVIWCMNCLSPGCVGCDEEPSAEPLSELNGHQKGCDCVRCREARIRADEREACAKIAELVSTGNTLFEVRNACAAAIRARGGGKR